VDEEHFLGPQEVAFKVAFEVASPFSAFNEHGKMLDVSLQSSQLKVS
jgi:hypothetical protein